MATRIKKLTTQGTSTAVVLDRGILEAADFTAETTVAVPSRTGIVLIRAVDLHDHKSQVEFDHAFWQEHTTARDRWLAAYRLAQRCWPESASTRLDRTACAAAPPWR